MHQARVWLACKTALGGLVPARFLASWVVRPIANVIVQLDSKDLPPRGLTAGYLGSLRAPATATLGRLPPLHVGVEGKSGVGC